jgi:glyoxylase-like metal-dependent hydrolase (beta-lactamase superfamily II)
VDTPLRVCDRVYMVGSSEISHGMDCCVYLIDAGELVLIDAGAGKSTDRLTDNMLLMHLLPENLTALILTHAHIDHIGSAAELREKYKIKVIAHEMDSPAIESGKKVGAEYYGARYRPCPVDIKLSGKEKEMQIGSLKFKFYHIPGHTQGSLAVILEIDGQKILFGQDIHGPYMPMWGGNPTDAAISLDRLIAVKADILCEGHYGVIRPGGEVEEFIREFRDALKSI